MKQSELIALIERTAPLAIAAPWDKSGVQVFRTAGYQPPRRVP